MWQKSLVGWRAEGGAEGDRLGTLKSQGYSEGYLAGILLSRGEEAGGGGAVGGGVGEDKSRRRGGLGRALGQPAPAGRSTPGSRSAGSMGKGGNQGEGANEREAPMPTFKWEEIQKHNLRTDKWLVIDRKVYNITKWSSRHPGGHRVIGHYAGEDATVRV